MSDLRKKLTLQVVDSVTADGLEDVPGWVDDASHTLTVIPADATTTVRADALGKRVTHVTVVPRGLNLTLETHRFIDRASGSDFTDPNDGVIYRIVQLFTLPRRHLAWLEVTT